MFVRMVSRIYDPYMKKQLEAMAEECFDMSRAFDSDSISYMLLEHARDCLLAVTELNLLDEDMPL